MVVMTDEELKEEEGCGCDGVDIGTAAVWNTEVRVLETKEQVMRNALAVMLTLSCCCCCCC